MLAFGLSVLLFIFWVVVGYAVLAALHKQNNQLQNMLLAPVVGLATTLLPIFWLNRGGIPVAHFGKALAIGLLLTSSGLLWRFRPKLPWREYLPFGSIFLLALFLTGRPMLEFGFDWVSYANDDMANYCLGANWFLNHGFFDVPKVDDLVDGRDYSLVYWFMYVPGGVRPGSELLLAWVCSLTGLTAHQIFMPTILAFHLILISTTGSLVCQSSIFRLAAVLTCTLLSMSAMTSLGTLYQLIAQVSGLGLLAGCTTLLLRPFKEMGIRAVVQHGMLTGILISGLLIVYPEVFPFLTLAFLLYTLIGLIQRRLTIKPLLLILNIVGLASLMLLNTYSIRVIIFLLNQTAGGTKLINLQEVLFPFYLVPSGLANLWSLQSIAKLAPEPLLSVSIALGGLLLLTVIIAAILLIRSGQPAPVVAAVMLSLSILLFVRKSDFGLFKLAMFIQPFMLGTLVIAWLSVFPRPFLRIMPLLLIGLISLYTQQTGYVEASRGSGSSSFIEIPNASPSGINREFQRLLSTTQSQQLLLDTSNVVLAKFQAPYTTGRATAFPSRDFFEWIYALAQKDPLLSSLNSEVFELTKSMLKTVDQIYTDSYFKLIDNRNPTAKNEFDKLTTENEVVKQSTINSNEPLLIATTSQQSIFNRRRLKHNNERNFVVQPWSEVHNHLVFNHSQLGQHYYFGDVKKISFYQLERDWFFPKQTICGIGRHFLFQVINPSKKVRLVVNMTTSLKSDGENQLPPAAAIGTERQRFPIIGRGSARVFSPPLSPQIITKTPYLGIDMGVEGQLFPDRKAGLMNLYGTSIPNDRRRLVGFGRDISLVSDEDYANLAAPSRLSSFPSDLTNPDLEYSGIYEDGWVSEASFLKLTQPSASSLFILHGTVPNINDSAFTSELRVLIDGKEVAQKILRPGEFDLEIEVPQGQEKRHIDLRFSKFQRLQSLDKRPVAAKLKFIGFADRND